MEMSIDSFQSISGWTASSSAIELSVNKFRSHILVGGVSLRIKTQMAKNVYFEKIYANSFDVSEYKNLRFAMSKYSEESDYSRDVFAEFKMKFSIGDTVTGVYTPKGEWFVPLFGKRTLDSVNVDISEIQSFNTIRFTVLDDNAEVWWLDNIIACNDEFVMDSLLAIKDQLDCKVKYSLGHPKAALVKGNEALELPDWVNVSRYSVIEISEGSLSEKHIVAGEVSNGSVEFEDEATFNGKALLNNYTTAAVISLVVPALIAGKHAPMVVPGIYIAGLVPLTDKAPLGEVLRDSFSTSTKKYRTVQAKRDIKLPVQIEVQCVLPELMISINNFIQHLFSDAGILLINGVKNDLTYEDTPRYDPGDLEGEIPYTIHYYSVEAIDMLDAEVSYVDIPSYTYNWIVDSL